eukprot:1157924-Pelagomonas_calceolata.AAC.19
MPAPRLQFSAARWHYSETFKSDQRTAMHTWATIVLLVGARSVDGAGLIDGVEMLRNGRHSTQSPSNCLQVAQCPCQLSAAYITATHFNATALKLPQNQCARPGGQLLLSYQLPSA